MLGNQLPETSRRHSESLAPVFDFVTFRYSKSEANAAAAPNPAVLALHFAALLLSSDASATARCVLYMVTRIFKVCASMLSLIEALGSSNSAGVGKLDWYQSCAAPEAAYSRRDREKDE